METTKSSLEAIQPKLDYKQTQALLDAVSTSNIPQFQALYRAMFIRMLGVGLRNVDIGRVFGISPQRVTQMIDKLFPNKELEKHIEETQYLREHLPAEWARAIQERFPEGSSYRLEYDERYRNSMAELAGLTIE